MCRDLQFDSGSSFLAKSTFYGPTSSNLLQISPIRLDRLLKPALFVFSYYLSLSPFVCLSPTLPFSLLPFSLLPFSLLPFSLLPFSLSSSLPLTHSLVYFSLFSGYSPSNWPSGGMYEYILPKVASFYLFNFTFSLHC